MTHPGQKVAFGFISIIRAFNGSGQLVVLFTDDFQASLAVQKYDHNEYQQGEEQTYPRMGINQAHHTGIFIQVLSFLFYHRFGVACVYTFYGFVYYGKKYRIIAGIDSYGKLCSIVGYEGGCQAIAGVPVDKLFRSVCVYISGISFVVKDCIDTLLHDYKYRAGNGICHRTSQRGIDRDSSGTVRIHTDN